MKFSILQPQRNVRHGASIVLARGGAVRRYLFAMQTRTGRTLGDRVTSLLIVERAGPARAAAAAGLDVVCPQADWQHICGAGDM
jgi:hypothetical protein